MKADDPFLTSGLNDPSDMARAVPLMIAIAIALHLSSGIVYSSISILLHAFEVSKASSISAKGSS